MNRIGYRYRFKTDARLKEARGCLLLALLAAEGLFGYCRLCQDVRCYWDQSINVFVIEAGTPVGIALNLIFTAFLSAELDSGDFDVRRVELLTPNR
ncbi:MAG TPA: hypothetical protein PKG77_22595 [Phycisphaerae bacterium]|nr:hypothetical protein [Phycisphaerae bacterium]HQL73940.1 hypothetical protein [Phycisphaerae bacterium]